jgi:hypothetical protein
MKISRVVDLHADAGWRVFSFLKIETTDGHHRDHGGLGSRKRRVAKLLWSPLFVLRVTPIGPLHAKLASVGNPASKRGHC